MTENVPQTSASDRYEAARKALAMHDDMQPGLHSAIAVCLADALRALITPPSVGESEERIVVRVMDSEVRSTDLPTDLILRGVRAGIQSAHEAWEPADVPSQEFMLRHLGIDYEFAQDDESGESEIFIPSQHIDREEI